MLITITLVLAIGVGLTYALIMGSSRPLENTFTAGDIKLSIAESTGSTYKLVPGTTIKKDPCVTVFGGSKKCYLFVKAHRSDGFDQYAEYSIDEGWNVLAGVADVYYRIVESSNADVVLHVLENDEIIVKDTVSEEMLALLYDSYPTLEFTAYAIQYEGIEDANTAWQKIYTGAPR